MPLPAAGGLTLFVDSHSPRRRRSAGLSRNVRRRQVRHCVPSAERRQDSGRMGSIRGEGDLNMDVRRSRDVAAGPLRIPERGGPRTVTIRPRHRFNGGGA